MRGLWFLLLILGISHAQAQDTTLVQTFTLDSTGRAAMFTFPDDPAVTYEKIIMQYRMRCHEALVGNGNVGCREWDYHCNTVITDSSKTDSVWSSHPNYVITGSGSNPYLYVTTPTFNYIQYIQREVTYTSTLFEDSVAVGNGSLNLEVPFNTNDDKSRTQILYHAEELQNNGLTQGDITGIRFQITEPGTMVRFLKIKMRHTAKDQLEVNNPDREGFTEVYFLNTTFEDPGKHAFNFYQPFTWNGTENILVECSFTLEEPGENNALAGTSTVETTMISTSEDDNYLAINQGDFIEVPAEAFSSLDSLITVSFWQFGDSDYMPFNSYIFEGADANNNRVISSHLPWGNSRVYWDAGNSGTGSYDRIDQAANPEDFEGQWNHWAMTKNAKTGVMKLYLNGDLWHSGTDKFRSMEGITKFKIAGNRNTGQYAGYVNEFRIWNEELDQQTIQDFMYSDVDAAHPFYDNMLVYYKLNTINDQIVYDDSPGNNDGILGGQPLYINPKGHQLFRNFEAFNIRPNIEFVRGLYGQNIEELYFLDSLQRNYNTVYGYSVINNDLIPTDTAIYWEAGYMPVYAETGELLDSIYTDPEGQLTIQDLEYYRRWPARFELLSFITPYGNGLDLGQEGVMWEFDVSDFDPILKGDKYLSIEGVGAQSEELDIRFLFIEGTPPRDVLTIQPIWPIANANQVWYGFGPGAIENDQVFEPREILMNPDATSFKVRSAVTGHGQSGEFVQKWHYINVDGDDWEFEYHVWNECSTIPIYPQGGTWLFDRAGWCPGDPTTLHEFDITPYVSPGQIHIIDYGLTNYGALGEANYRVANQLVTYGPANFSLDASVVGIVRPNAKIAKFKRFNPACTLPEITIKNTGSTELTSLDIDYWVEGGNVQSHTWTGNLDFLESEQVVLPIPDYSFWLGNGAVFYVTISSPNGGTDEYQNNNNYRIKFETTDVYDLEESLEVHCMTNNLAYQTSYFLEDASGNLIFERDNLDNNTLYTDALSLTPGCYKLRIDDAGDNGLYYWYNTGQGTGYLRLKNASGYILENFEPEFGRFAEYEFAVVDLTGEKERKHNDRISIFPNPVNRLLKVEMAGYEGKPVGLILKTASMQTIYTEQINVRTKVFYHEIPTDALTPGFYLLQVNCGNQTITMKVIKN